MVRLHPRERIVTDARLELNKVIDAWYTKYDDHLTAGEVLGVIGDVLGSEVTRLAKYMVRTERHPDSPDTPGGLE